MKPKSDNLIRKRKKFLIQRRSGNYSSPNSREVTSKWKFDENHRFWKSRWDSQEPLFLTFLEVIPIFLGIGNNPNKLYIFEKLRLDSRRWCYFQGCSCYKKCTLATISTLAPNAWFDKIVASWDPNLTISFEWEKKSWSNAGPEIIPDQIAVKLHQNEISAKIIWWNPKTYCKSMISTLSQEPLFSTFLEVISIFLDIGNNPNKLYIFEKLRSGSRRWCYFQGSSCYQKCTLATISMLAPNARFEPKL